MNKLTDTAILQAMFKEATLGIVVAGADGKIRYINVLAEKQFGYAPNELVNQPVELLVPNSKQSGHASYRHHYQKDPQPRLMGEGRELEGKRKDGSTFPIEISLSPVEVENVPLVIAFVHDISQRKKASDALSESESRLSAVINTAVDGIITINDRGIVETMNPAAARLFGYDPLEVIGNKVNMLMAEPEISEHDQYLKNYQETGEKKIIGIGREVTGRKKDGTTFPFHLGINEVQLKGRKIYTGILHDLTDKKNADEKVRRYTKALERSNQELQDFAYVSSHDLQEPLRKIRAFGDRLNTMIADRLNEKESDYLNRMMNGAERMQNLIADLLEFSRVNTHAKQFEKVDLNEIAQNVISDLSIIIEKNNGKIILDKLPIIEADPTQMWQLFQNLIKNAVKFRKPDVDPVVKIHCEKTMKAERLRGTPGDTEYKIYFKDNGIGFDEKYTDKIFQIFQRLEGRKYEGTGIGLAVCMRIANRHGGDISALSKPGEGTTFVVTLSAAQTPETF